MDKERVIDHAGRTGRGVGRRDRGGAVCALVGGRARRCSGPLARRG